MPELLILTNGLRGAGKTTLAGELKRTVGCQVISKDTIKEAVDDRVQAVFAPG